MFAIKRLFIFAVVLALLSACRKPKADIIGEQQDRYSFSQLPRYHLTPFKVKGKLPDSLHPFLDAAAVLAAHKAAGNPEIPGGGISVTPHGPSFTDGLNGATYNYAELFDANEFVVTTGNTNVVYPGSIIKGSSIEDFGLIPILGYGRPITVSVSIPTSPLKVSKTLPIATPSGMRQVVRDALTTDFAGSAGFSRFNYQMKAFTYYQELKTLYGYNTKSNLLFVTNSTHIDKNLAQISGKSGIMVKFIQQNFSIDMDIPEAGQLIDPNVDPSVYGGYQPIYISSVIYGRMGIMTIESEAEQSKAEATFRKAFNVLGIINGGNSLTSEETALIDAAEIKVSVAGVSGEEAVRLVGGVQGLTALLAKGMTYDAASPGVPIAFKMKDIATDSLIAAPFQVDYGTYDKVYASLEIENRYQVGTGGAGATYEYGDLYLAFYQWPNKIQPVAAPNFVPFNYLINTVTENRQYGPNGYHNRSERNEDVKVRNSLKNTRQLLQKDARLRYLVKYYNPNQPNNGNQSESIYTYRLKPGPGYLIQP